MTMATATRPFRWDPPAASMTLKHAGRRYVRGETVELTEADARRIAAAHTAPVRVSNDPKAPPSVRSAVVDVQYPVLKTMDGKPFAVEDVTPERLDAVVASAAAAERERADARRKVA